MGVKSTLLAGGLLALAMAGPAGAVVINSTVPTWSDIVGGSSTVLNSTNGAFTGVRWGAPAGGGNSTDQKSGLGFDPVSPPNATIPVNTNFLLGTLQHYNNPIISGTAASSVNLSLATSVAGAVPVTQTFSYHFLIDETPNVGPVISCAYPSTTPYADRITFQNLDTSSSFAISGVSYTLALSGFSTDNGATISNSFISQEGGTNQVGLYATFTAASVPEPVSLAILGAGLIGMGMLRRSRVPA